MSRGPLDELVRKHSAGTVEVDVSDQVEDAVHAVIAQAVEDGLLFRGRTEAQSRDEVERVIDWLRRESAAAYLGGRDDEAELLRSLSERVRDGEHRR